MQFYWVAAAFAGQAAALQLWQFLAARGFPMHRRAPLSGYHPAITVLKPLKGADPFLASCLRSWLQQEYPGPVQILFGVHDPADPAAEIVRQLLAAHPHVDARLLVCPERLGTNAKVGTLCQLEPNARHEMVVVSDADVHAPPDLLSQLVLPLQDAEVGLVNCFYRLANPVTPALRWEAVAVNSDFWSQVLQSRTLKTQDFALGAAMILRRADLTTIGGFRGLVDHLADDYHLGNRIHGLGRRIELSTIPVDCWDPPAGWASVWAHQVRWTRTVRVCQPLPFAASLLSNGSLWAFLWLGVALALSAAWWPAAALLALRAYLAAVLYRRLRRGLAGHAAPWRVWLKDLLGVALWATAFLGDSIVWRGTRFRVLRDGRLAPMT